MITWVQGSNSFKIDEILSLVMYASDILNFTHLIRYIRLKLKHSLKVHCVRDDILPIFLKNNNELNNYTDTLRETYYRSTYLADSRKLDR